METHPEGESAACGCGPECETTDAGPADCPCCSGIKEAIQKHSCAAALIGLGGGLLAGYLVGQRVAGRRNQSERHTAERLGQRIMDHLDRMLPERMAKRFRG